MIIKTSTGMLLDTEFGMAKDITRYGKLKGLNCLCCGVNNGESYLLLVDNIPVFESSSAEDVGVHIDIMVLANDESKK